MCQTGFRRKEDETVYQNTFYTERITQTKIILVTKVLMTVCLLTLLYQEVLELKRTEVEFDKYSDRISTQYLNIYKSPLKSSRRAILIALAAVSVWLLTTIVSIGFIIKRIGWRITSCWSNDKNQNLLGALPGERMNVIRQMREKVKDD